MTWQLTMNDEWPPKSGRSSAMIDPPPTSNRASNTSHTFFLHWPTSKRISTDPNDTTKRNGINCRRNLLYVQYVSINIVLVKSSASTKLIKMKINTLQWYIHVDRGIGVTLQHKKLHTITKFYFPAHEIPRHTQIERNFAKITWHGIDQHHIFCG